jgi:RNA polymerase sigma-70 factor (ECF subfamily)
LLAPLSAVDSAADARIAPPFASAERSAERDLVTRMQAGNADAFGTAYERFAGRVYAFALRRLRDPTEAEDLCQDVFVEVARSIHGFQGRSALSTWILGIANHEVANRRRRSHRDVVPFDESGELSIPARQAPVDRQVDSARILARCFDMLDREIGPAHRQIFQLHLSGAGNMAAIAITVGKSRQAVKISVFRTRKLLGARVAGLRELVASR